LSLFRYPITLSPNKTFDFITDAGYTYSIYFNPDQQLFNDPILDQYGIYFGFICRPDHNSRPFDPKAGETIMYVIAEFFKNHPQSILAYICSGNNNQERQRQILFSKWYNASPLKAHYTFTKKQFEDIYCGVIYDKNHPNFYAIEEAFLDFSLTDKLNEPAVYYEYMDQDEEDLI
jgi:Family of unknown function (DUF6169)